MFRPVRQLRLAPGGCSIQATPGALVATSSTTCASALSWDPGAGPGQAKSEAALVLGEAASQRPPTEVLGGAVEMSQDDWKAFTIN